MPKHDPLPRPKTTTGIRVGDNSLNFDKPLSRWEALERLHKAKAGKSA